MKDLDEQKAKDAKNKQEKAKYDKVEAANSTGFNFECYERDPHVAKKRAENNK